MAGSVILSGGDDFSPEGNALVKAMLGLARQSAPRLVVVPVAAADNPRKAARNSTGAFSALGARAEPLSITDADTAHDPSLSVSMENAHIIYLTDGNPLDAVEGLAGSEALAKLGRAWQNGVVLAASGAAAMALCDLYWDSGVWEKGLSLLKGIVVLPHHEFLVGRFSADRLRQDLPAGYLILGLDDATGVIVDGQRASVVGPETVTVYRADGEQEYGDGDHFDLDTPLDFSG
jgi:cyanophycinase